MFMQGIQYFLFLLLNPDTVQALQNLPDPKIKRKKKKGIFSAIKTMHLIVKKIIVQKGLPFSNIKKSLTKKRELSPMRKKCYNVCLAVCPRILDPFFGDLIYKMGQEFLGIQCLVRKCIHHKLPRRWS